MISTASLLLLASIMSLLTTLFRLLPFLLALPHLDACCNSYTLFFACNAAHRSKDDQFLSDVYLLIM